jgi:uncharacterized surface protein with fasciclin (FAS1) repeats
MKRISYKNMIGKSIALFFFLTIIAACVQPPQELLKKSDEMVISDFVANDKDRYTEFAKLLESSVLDGFLAIRGPYTLFLPTDEAMKAFYVAKNIGSITELSIEEQQKLVYNHLILGELNANDIGLGAIRELNALGDKLATEFVGSNTVINKVATITKRNIRAANGFVHEIDHVLEPITINIYDVIKSDPSYSLFTQGLELTGIKDTLLIEEYPWGIRQARTYFTLLAVPDTIFNRYGIMNINDLINYFTDEPNKITELENGFYQYIEYHCLNGAHYFTDLSTKLYPILSFNNNVLVSIEDDYKLNKNTLENTYTGFIIEHSNVPARNGVLHVINDLLPVETPEPTRIIFDTCEQLELINGDFYMKYYKKFYDGQNDFKNIKFEGDYLQYYYKDRNAPVQVNYDGLQMIGLWWLEVTTPKVMKGKYEISGYVWGIDRVCDVYINGERIFTLLADGSYDRIKWGEIEITETSEIKVRMVAKRYGTIFWDTIELTPIID